MLFNTRSLFSAAIITCSLSGASALDLKPLTAPSALPTGRSVRRAAPEPINLAPVSDFGVLTHGRSLRRDVPGNGCFDPASESNFFWGAFSDDNIFMANFTLYHPGDDELILPIENFAKEVKSIECGSKDNPVMVIAFKDQNTFNYAKSAWDWVNKKDINTFTVVTQPNQCYQGDNRSPYLVHTIKFDDAKLTASLQAEEQEWIDVAHTFHLHVGHEYVDPSTANVTHPHLKRGDGETTMDISHSIKQNLFNFAKDSPDTAGLALSADVDIAISGKIIADFDVIKTKPKALGFTSPIAVPTDVKMTLHPQGVNANFGLTLNADGTLGKALDWSLPEIDIPVSALNIIKIIKLGPYVTMGVHVGATQLTGTATLTTGAKATIDDSAHVDVQLGDGTQNSIDGWTPHFDKIDPTFSAEIDGSVKAWAQLGVNMKAEVFGKWGYEAGIDAQLPYFEANLKGQVDSAGVCGTQKTIGAQVDANVGIDINLNAGKPDKAPDFQKDLFTTSWNLFTTCMGIGPDNAKTPTPTPESTAEPTPTDGPSDTVSPTDEPTATGEDPASTPVETGSITTPISAAITTAPYPTITSRPTGIIGTGTAGTGSAGFPITASNSTLLTMAKRRPTQLYL